MKRRDLRLVKVRTQTVVSVVLWQFAQCLLNSIFNFREGGVLGCDTQIVCVDLGWADLCVDVEKDRGENTSYLVVGHSSVVTICFDRCSVPHRVFCLTVGSVRLYTMHCLV